MGKYKFWTGKYFQLERYRQILRSRIWKSLKISRIPNGIMHVYASIYEHISESVCFEKQSTEATRQVKGEYKSIGTLACRSDGSRPWPLTSLLDPEYESLLYTEPLGATTHNRRTYTLITVVRYTSYMARVEIYGYNCMSQAFTTVFIGTPEQQYVRRGILT